MIAPVDAAYRLTTGAELAAAADLVYTSIPGLNRAVVSEWFPPEHAKTAPHGGPHSNQTRRTAPTGRSRR